MINHDLELLGVIAFHLIILQIEWKIANDKNNKTSLLLVLCTTFSYLLCFVVDHVYCDYQFLLLFLREIFLLRRSIKIVSWYKCGHL